MQIFQTKLISSDGCHYSFSSIVNPSHNIFKGHFPENPVVPGVCTMAMIKDCCAIVLSRGVKYDYIKEVKFLSAIIPSIHSELMVDIELKSVDDQINLTAKVVSGDTIMMKLKGTII